MRGSSTPSPDAPVNAPYGLLAQHYDRLCSYAAPLNRHARGRILRTALPKVHRVCDLGCGSGETAVELARRGLEVHAVDLSPVFCDAVRAKARRAGLTVNVHCQDMRDFTLPRPVDLVLAEFASLNNLADRRDLARVLESVARALAADGWFLFDVNTPLSLRTQYAQTITGMRTRRSSSCSAEASRRTAGGQGSTSIGSCPRDASGATCAKRYGTSAGPTPRSVGHCESRASIAYGGSTESTCARGCRTRSAGRMPTTSPENERDSNSVLCALRGERLLDSEGSGVACYARR